MRCARRRWCRRSAPRSCCIWSRSARRCRSGSSRRLAAVDVPMMWHQTFDEVPDGPAIVLANELFDALPVNQAIKQFNGWYERVVEIDADGNLAFGIAERCDPAVRPARAGKRCATPRSARSTNGAPTICRSRSAAGWRVRAARAGDRLRPRRERAPATPCRRSAGTPSSIRCSRPARSTSPPMSISRRSRSPPKAWARA